MSVSWSAAPSQAALRHLAKRVASSYSADTKREVVHAVADNALAAFVLIQVALK